MIATKPTSKHGEPGTCGGDQCFANLGRRLAHAVRKILHGPLDLSLPCVRVFGEAHAVPRHVQSGSVNRRPLAARLIAIYGGLLALVRLGLTSQAHAAAESVFLQPVAARGWVAWGDSGLRNAPASQSVSFGADQSTGYVVVTGQ